MTKDEYENGMRRIPSSPKIKLKLKTQNEPGDERENDRANIQAG